MRKTRPPSSDLDICPACHASFVHPVEWSEADAEHWRIWLRCGECWLEREVLVTDAVAARFDVAVDRGTKLIAGALARLDGERMTRQADALATALALDLIDAADFGA